MFGKLGDEMLQRYDEADEVNFKKGSLRRSLNCIHYYIVMNAIERASNYTLCLFSVLVSY